MIDRLGVAIAHYTRTGLDLHANELRAGIKSDLQSGRLKLVATDVDCLMRVLGVPDRREQLGIAAYGAGASSTARQPLQGRVAAQLAVVNWNSEEVRYQNAERTYKPIADVLHEMATLGLTLERKSVFDKLIGGLGSEQAHLCDAFFDFLVAEGAIEDRPTDPERVAARQQGLNEILGDSFRDRGVIVQQLLNTLGHVHPAIVRAQLKEQASQS